jgi:nitrate reductase (NAD(P)H)
VSSNTWETPDGWIVLHGHLSREMWDSYLEKQNDNGEFMILVCGPPGMVNAVRKLAEETGIHPSRVVYFSPFV